MIKGARLHKFKLLAVAALIASLASSTFAFDEQAYLAKFLETHAAHLTAWNKMLAGGQAPAWLRRYLDLHGAESPATLINVAGASYQVFTSCKPHDCFTSFAVIFSPDGAVAWGAMADYGAEPQFYGAPDASVAEALRRALRAQ